MLPYHRKAFLILEEKICSIANEDPLGIVQIVQPEGSYFWDGTKMPYKIENYSMPNSFFTAGVISVSASALKYARPAALGWSPVVLNTAM